MKYRLPDHSHVPEVSQETSSQTKHIHLSKTLSWCLKSNVHSAMYINIVVNLNVLVICYDF